MIVLPASQQDLDELLAAVAAKANHETNRRRQNRLDSAFTELEHALHWRREPSRNMRGMETEETPTVSSRERGCAR